MGEQLREMYTSLERRVNDRTRELNQANHAKSRLLAAASHDLRQPMHALSLFVGQLQDSKTTDERIALTQRIERAVGSLSELLDQLLDLSKLEAGAVQAVQEDFAVRDMLLAIEVEFAPLARVKGIELRVLPTNAWSRSDPILVRQNLVEPGRKRNPLHRTRWRVDRLPQAWGESAYRGLGYRLRHSRRSTRRRVP